MRPYTASVISGFLHTLGLGVLGMWTVQAVQIQFRVAAGQAVTIQLSFDAAEQQPEEPLEIDLNVPEPTQPAPEPQPLDDLQLERRPQELLVTTHVPVELQLPDLAPAPPLPRRQRDDLPDPPDDRPPPRPKKRDLARETPPAEITSIALPLQASLTAGVNRPDVWPSPLPLNPNARYPSDALAQRIEGVVSLRLKVAADGTVKDAVIERSSGWPSLDASALQVIWQWRFSPATRQGVPVEAEFILPFDFHLRRS